VQLLNKYHTNEETLRVGRATSVFESDDASDEIVDRYAEVNTLGDSLDDKQQTDIDRLEKKHAQTLTKEPGLTDLVVFRLDTGESAPISQRPYNTPVHFRESIDKEIEWLLQKGFIRQSTSAWASPMVTVKKTDGSAKLCVDL